MNQDGKNKGNSLIIINVYHERDRAELQDRKTDLQIICRLVIYLFHFYEKT